MQWKEDTRAKPMPQLLIGLPSPRSQPCSLEEQYFKCGIFWDYDAPQRRVSNSEAPVLAGGIPVFLRGSQFSGASELKGGPVSKYKFINHRSLVLHVHSPLHGQSQGWIFY